MPGKTYNTFIDDQSTCWITDGDRMIRVNADLFVRYSYQAYHEGGFSTIDEGRRLAEQATAEALFMHLARATGRASEQPGGDDGPAAADDRRAGGGDDEQVA